MEDKRIVEIGGVKVEVDMRTAKTVESYKVGDNVRVLVKQYNDTFTAHSGIIVAFDDFKELPTIVVAYVDASSYEAAVKMAHINAKSQGTEIAPATNAERLIDVARVEELLMRKIGQKEMELADAKAQLAYFKKWLALAVKES